MTPTHPTPANPGPSAQPLTDEALAAIAFRRAGWALLVVDPADNRIVAANLAAADLYGYPVADLVGLAIDELFAPAARLRLPEYRAQVHRTGRAAYTSLHQRRDGSQFTTDVVVTADYDDQGRVRYRIVAARAVA